MKPISKEEVLKKLKPRGKYQEVAKKYLMDFLNEYKELGVEAQAIYFNEIQVDPKALYKSMLHLTNKENFPMKIVLDSEEKRIMLLHWYPHEA